MVGAPEGTRMTPRVARLRQETLETRPWLSAERSQLITAFYRNAPLASVPVTRALALAHVLEHKAIYIGDDELIVGERGPAPKGTPTYPELCCHTLEDLEVRAFGSFGRIYLGGEERDVIAGARAAVGAIENMTGKEMGASRKA